MTKNFHKDCNGLLWDFTENNTFHLFSACVYTVSINYVQVYTGLVWLYKYCTDLCTVLLKAVHLILPKSFFAINKHNI